MIAKEKTTFKTYRDNKGKDQVLHQRPREGIQGRKKELEELPPSTPTQDEIQICW